MRFKYTLFIQIVGWLIGTTLLGSINAWATHIRAGHITLTQNATSNPFSYKLTLTLYLDVVEISQPEASLVVVPIIGGQRRTAIGQVTIRENIVRRMVGPSVSENIYTTDFTFPGSGQYVVYFEDENRNSAIVNMSNSVNTSFYVESYLVLNTSLGSNTPPRLMNKPVDVAKVGVVYRYNPVAFDPDGDSLAYRLIAPRQSATTAVANYRSPETVGPPFGTPESGTGAPGFSINAFTGDVIWNAPGAFGIGSRGFAEYAVALVVEEWRRLWGGEAIKIGEITSDVQITVREQPNRRPALIIPKDTFIVVGSVLRATIQASDPDNNQQVRISSESAVFSASASIFPNQSAAVLNPPNVAPRTFEQYVFRGNPAQSQLEWQTGCQHARAQPYDIVFKAEDNASLPNQLTDTRTWRVTIIGSAPIGVTAQAEASGIRIGWQTYTCPANTSLSIWRKEGCTSDAFGAYTVGSPAGYQLVGMVLGSATSFTDNSARSGVSYTYRVAANTSRLVPAVYTLSAPTQCLSVTFNNTPPVVVITAPSASETFVAPATINVAVNATDADGSINKVELHLNDVKVDEDATAPYNFVRVNVPPGQHKITVKAYDNAGASTLSEAVTATVNDDVTATERLSGQLFSAYPNPFGSEVYLRYPSSIREITAINSLGISVRIPFQYLGNEIFRAETGSLHSGLYILKVVDIQGREGLKPAIKAR